MGHRAARCCTETFIGDKNEEIGTCINRHPTGTMVCRACMISNNFSDQKPLEKSVESRYSEYREIFGSVGSPKRNPSFDERDIYNPDGKMKRDFPDLPSPTSPSDTKLNQFSPAGYFKNKGH